MCELFALNAEGPVNTNAYLREFFSHSVNHPHGWGISWRDGDPFDDASVTLVREGRRAIDSDLNWQVLGSPIEKSHVLAHIRYATGTDMAERNCHPFRTVDMTGRQWTLIHNGILFNEGLTFPYEDRTEGETDSERMAAFLTDVMDEAYLRGAKPTFDVRFGALAGAVTQLANRNRVNIILDDGEYTYVHTNTSKCTLFYRSFTDEKGGQAIVVSTTCLGGSAEAQEWKPVPANRLIALRDGRLVRTSAPHGYRFCETILELQRKMGVRPEDYVA